jgi:flagellar L-ring protein precursor FlgH
MRTLDLALVATFFAAQSAAAAADSLWDRRDSRSAFLFEDTRARRVGDLLTIVVRESTDIGQREKRALDKKSEFRGLFNFNGKSSGNFPDKSASAELDTAGSSNRKFDGKAEFSSERDFVDRMTVSIVDVFPNGNLLVEGTRRRVVSGEERLLRVSGLVRPQDIGPGNIVESQFIANFQVSYDGKGTESKFTNQGWLSRAVNRVWPF